MNGLNYGAENTAEALKERIRINNRELYRLCELKKATEYRINNSNDENEIKKFKNDIEKYDAQISTLKNDSIECMEDLKKIEK